MSLVQEMPLAFLLTNELQKIPEMLSELFPCTKICLTSRKLRNFSMEKFLKDMRWGGVAPEWHQTRPKGKIEQF